MGKKRKDIIKKVFNNLGLLAPYMNLTREIDKANPFIIPNPDTGSGTSSETIIATEADLKKVIDSLANINPALKYNRTSTRARVFKEAIRIDETIYDNINDADLVRYHLAHEKMLIDNPGASQKKINELNADFAQEMQAHMYQKAKDELNALLLPGAQPPLDTAVRARAEELQTLILGYEGRWWGYYRNKADLLTGLLATLNYVRKNDPKAENMLESIPKDMQEITEYNAEMKQLQTMSSIGGYQSRMVANSIIDRVKWGGFPGFYISMPERILALQAVKLIANHDWEAFKQLKGIDQSRFFPQLEEMVYFEIKTALRSAITGTRYYSLSRMETGSAPGEPYQGTEDAIVAVGDKLYHADSITGKVTIIALPDALADRLKLDAYNALIVKCGGDRKYADSDAYSQIETLVVPREPLSPKVQAEFNNLMDKIAIRDYEYIFGFRIPLTVRAAILTQARAGIIAVQTGEAFVITVNSPYKEYIENEIAKINYVGQLSRLEHEIKGIENQNIKPLEIAALGQLKASIDGYGSYFTVSRHDRTEALKLAQRVANNTLNAEDGVLIAASPYKNQIDSVGYARSLDTFDNTPMTSTDPTVLTAIEDMKNKIKRAPYLPWSSLTLPERTRGLTVLTALAAGKRTNEIPEYASLPVALKRKADRIEYEGDKAVFNTLLADPGVPESAKLAVRQLSARADNTYSSFRLHITQRGLGFMAGSLLMNAAKKGTPKEQLDELIAKVEELLADSKYEIYKEEIDQVAILMASAQIDNALQIKSRLTPETLRLIKELQEHSKDTRIPLATRLAALKSARDYAGDPRPIKKALFEIEVRKIPAYFKNAGNSITNLLWTNPRMAGFSSHIDELDAEGSEEYEAAYEKLCFEMVHPDNEFGQEQAAAIRLMKDKIDTAATSSWSSLTSEQRTQGLVFLSNYIIATRGGYKNASSIDGYKELPPVLQRRADAIDYSVLKAFYAADTSLLKDKFAIIITRADTRWGVDIKTRTLGYEAARDMLFAMQRQVGEKKSTLEKLEEVAAKPEYASYKAEMEHIIMEEARSQLNTELDASTIVPEYKKLLSELSEITKDSRIPLQVRLEAMKAATAYAGDPSPDNKAALETAIKAIPEHFTTGAGKSIFNCLWTTPKMTGFMTRINDTMNPAVHITPAATQPIANPVVNDEDAAAPAALGMHQV